MSNMNQIIKHIPVYNPETREHAFVDVDVEVNVDSLARQLARKAAYTRSGETTVVGGAVTVRIRSKEVVK